MKKRIVKMDFVVTGILILMALLLFFLENYIFTLTGGNSVLSGVLLALIPAIIWLSFYYRKDFLEPEPRILIFKVFLLSSLITYGILNPLLNNLFMVNEWIGISNVFYKIIGSILILGVLQEFTVYFLIRFSVYNLPEFDEKVDGIIYGTVVGIGLATALNIHFIQETQIVSLFSGFVYMTIKVLGHGGLGGLVGFIITKEKFDNWNVAFVSTGLIVVSILNGIFFYIISLITRSNLFSGNITQNLFLNLLFAGLFAAGVTLLANHLIKKSRGKFEESRKNNGVFQIAVIVLIFVVFFTMGINYKDFLVNSWQNITAADIRLKLPQSWMVRKEDNNFLVSAFDPYSIYSQFNIILKDTDVRHLNKFVESRVETKKKLNKTYMVINNKATDKFGPEGFYVEGGYLKKEADNLYLILNKEYIFRHGNKVLVISLSTENKDYIEAPDKYLKIINSIERRSQ